MSQDRKRSFFGSLFRPKTKTEEELEAERESRQKIEERIREVLAINDLPALPELMQQPAAPTNAGFLEIVYGGSDPAHTRASLQPDQPSVYLPHESDSNLRIAPAKEWFRPELEQPAEFQPEQWRVRKRAANG